MANRYFKKYLLTPGPTQVPEQALGALAKPIIHHRTPEFSQLMLEVQTGLRYLFQTQNEVLILAASGTGAMEASVTNLFSPGDTVIVINAGKFGDRFLKIAKAYQLNAQEIFIERGQTLNLTQLENALKQHPQCKGVLFQASETSTGTLMPTQKIADLVKQYPNCLCIVDAITALGVFELPMDQWLLDVVITGSQKALMLPPGMACIALSAKAWRANAQAQLPHFYFDLAKEKKAIAQGQTAWTPPIAHIQALKETLNLIQQQTLPQVFARHRLLATATRNALKALGLTLLAQSPSDAVSAVLVPPEITDGKKIPKIMRDEFGVAIAGGQDELEGKIFRLTHLGFIDRFDILVGIGALELTLQKLNYKKFELGAGTAAILKTFQENLDQTPLI